MLIHERLLNLVKSYFPDTPIYPTLGNHDAHPVNTYVKIIISNVARKKFHHFNHLKINKVCTTGNNRSRTWHRVALSRCWASMDQVWASKWNFFYYPSWRLLHCFNSTRTKNCFLKYQLLLHIQLVDTFFCKRSSLFTFVAYKDTWRCRNSQWKGINGWINKTQIVIGKILKRKN